MTRLRRRKGKESLAILAIGYLLVLALLTTLTASATAAVLVAKAVRLPKLNRKVVGSDPQRTRLLAADGSTLAVFYYQNRENTTLDKVPPVMREAMIAIEDRRFYKHSGVDFGGIMRAMATNVQHRGIVEGGSTISQQYVKNAFLSNERTVSRKVREVALAYQLEKKYSKRKILELYLNSVYFGDGAWGIKAAAEHYFNKSVSDLNLQESALLAAMPKAPTKYSPYLSPENARLRRNLVLAKMRKQRLISKEEFQAASSQPVVVVQHATAQDPRTAHFVEFVRRRLVEKYGAKTFLRGGWTVQTTLDLRMQIRAQEAVETTLNRPGDPSASLVSIEPKTGFIRAMVGGRDFAGDNFNLAVQSKRQAGSSFKPFVLIAALEQGMSPQTTFSGSSPIVIPMHGQGPDWRVGNFGGQGYGSMTLVEATVKSVNVVYAQLIMKVGPQSVADVARRMGIMSEIEAKPPIALGGFTYGVSALDMASAYSTLANNGEHAAPTAIVTITNTKGEVVYEHKDKPKRVLSPEVAGTATSILRQVVERGTGKRAAIGRPAAGKTGSSSNLRDAWFVGYTPELATAVWVGYPKQQIEMNSVHGIGVVGGTFPAEIWQKFMSDALAGVPATDFNGSRVDTPKEAQTAAAAARRSERASDNTPPPAQTPTQPTEAPKPEPTPAPDPAPKPRPVPPPPPPEPATGTP